LPIILIPFPNIFPIHFHSRFPPITIFSLLNSHLHDVFHQTFCILNTAFLNSVAIPEDFNTPLSQISEFKLQIDTLSSEVALCTRSFEASIAVVRQIFSENLDDLETELKDIKQSFDD
jgi:hypothetical protein